MGSWIKRIRGAIGVGLTWSVVWGLFGGIVGLVMGFPEFGLDVAIFFAWRDAAMGFLGGATFATVLRLTEGRRRFDELRLSRFAAWGGLGGGLIGIGYLGAWWLFGGVAVDAAAIPWLTIPTLLGAGSAAGSLALARATEDGRLLDSRTESAEVGLTSDEKRRLLGDPT